MKKIGLIGMTVAQAMAVDLAVETSYEIKNRVRRERELDVKERQRVIREKRRDKRRQAY